MLGEGAVTIVDGRAMSTNIAEIPDHATPEMIDVRLHLLPSGSKYQLPQNSDEEAICRGDAPRIPQPLLEFLENVTKRNPIS